MQKYITSLLECIRQAEEQDGAELGGSRCGEARGRHCRGARGWAAPPWSRICAEALARRPCWRPERPQGRRRRRIGPGGGRTRLPAGGGASGRRAVRGTISACSSCASELSGRRRCGHGAPAATRHPRRHHPRGRHPHPRACALAPSLMHAAAPDAVDAAARARGLAPAAPDPLEETRIRAGEGGPLPARVDETEAAVARSSATRPPAVARSSASPRWLRREVAGGGGQKRRRHDEEAEAGGGGGRRRRSSSCRSWVEMGGEEAKKSAAASNRLLRRSIELRWRRIELPVTSSPCTTPAPPPRRAGRGFISLPRPRTTLACPSPPALPQLRLPCSRTRTRARVCRGRVSRLPWCARSAASETRTASGTSCPRDSERRAGKGGAAEASGAAGGAAVAAAAG